MRTEIIFDGERDLLDHFQQVLRRAVVRLERQGDRLALYVETEEFGPEFLGTVDYSPLPDWGQLSAAIEAAKLNPEAAPLIAFRAGHAPICGEPPEAPAPVEEGGA
jgi:hypothetical protein